MEATTAAEADIADGVDTFPCSPTRHRSSAVVYCGAEQLVSLTGILQYGRELNRSQGVGFTLWRVKMCVWMLVSLSFHVSSF